MHEPIDATKHYRFASDFDQTLSFNVSGVVRSEMLGLGGFHGSRTSSVGTPR